VLAYEPLFPQINVAVLIPIPPPPIGPKFGSTRVNPVKSTVPDADTTTLEPTSLIVTTIGADADDEDAVGVIVIVGVNVGVGVLDALGVPAGVPVGVDVGVFVLVTLGVGVFEVLGVPAGVPVGVGVGVGVGLEIFGVLLGVGVGEVPPPLLIPILKPLSKIIPI
jgi:hypothetical protein